MKNYVIIFLFIFTFPIASALVPIEGVIYGEVQDVKQYDPFAGMLTYKYFDSKESPAEHDKLTHYIALYKQGMGLSQQCESLSKVDYDNFWKEDTAKRSVIATLQYIGLDLTIKSIANYAKKFELSEEKYTNLYTNLVNNTCSKNISVYSHKMLKNNFKYFWTNDTGFENPSIEKSPYFNVQLKKKHNTKTSYEREFNYSIHNFRAFCSWNSDSDNLGLIINYLKNPFIMSYIFNNLLKKKISIDSKTEEVFLEDTTRGIQVACENMICRRRTPEDFNKHFPRMHGSSKLEDDLKVIYCTHFRNHRTSDVVLNEKIKKWTDEQSPAQRSIEPMHFLSLVSGYPDFMILAESFDEVLSDFKDNIQLRWNRWAWEKSSQFNMEQLYEEPLEISLVSQVNTNAVELGNFNINFNIELGELDKVLDGHDKISSYFNLQFPAAYVTLLKERIPFLFNSNRHKELNELEKKLVENINLQLEKQKKHFKVPIWNDRMANIIADEFLSQINKLNKYRFNKLDKNVVLVPVKFNFGVFALQYIRKKYIFHHSQKKSVSYK